MKRALIAICMLSLIGGAATWAVAGDAKAPDKPIELKSSEHKKMWVKFNHATHESVECDVCHHAAPSDAKDAYVSCGASEECHSLKGTRERDPQSLFWAYHTKNSERSCYGCHTAMLGPGCRRKVSHSLSAAPQGEILRGSFFWSPDGCRGRVCALDRSFSEVFSGPCSLQGCNKRVSLYNRSFGTAGGLSGVLACLDFRILAFPERPERKPADGRAICGRAAGFSMETRMRIGKWDHDAFVAVVKDFHGHVAPGVIIGGYMVEMARRTLPEGILYDAVSETVQCLPDAIQLLTPCTVGNGWLKVYHFGIYALSLYDKYTGEGTRVRLNVEALDAYPHVRAWFLKEKPKREQEPELLREEIRTAGMDLLQAAPVRIHPDFLVKKGKGVVRRCPRCGEWYPAVLGDLCRRCQGDGPYLAGKE